LPNYTYAHPQTGEIKEIFQSMNEEHVYSENGVKWERVWSKPQAAFDIKIDEWSPKGFVNKTGKNSGKMHELWDRSKELSLKRADKNGGVDPIKEKAKEEWSKKRNGRKFPTFMENQI
jgi:hypothetical protein